MRLVPSKNFPLKSAAGFTLLELVISITILATLMVGIAVTTQQALRAKKRIQEQVDDMSQVRDSLRVIEKDLQMAFHAVDIEKEFKDAVKAKAKKTTPVANPNPQGTGSPAPISPPTIPEPEAPNPEELNRKDPTTHFDGKEGEVYFPTLNTSRMTENLAQGDFAMVGYLVSTCNEPGKKETLNCLIRKYSANIDEPTYEKMEPTVLLSGVTEFKFRYLGTGRSEWATTWNTKSSDSTQKNKFPQIVEISLTIEKPMANNDKKKKISMQIVAPIRFPNNPS